MDEPNFPLRRKGLVNLPGITPDAKRLVEILLSQSAQRHHCFFQASGVHNHLNHHLLAAYDLGASPSLLQQIYDEEERIQRPIYLDDAGQSISITEEIWTQYIQNPSAYASFVQFFLKQIKGLGKKGTIEKYIFSPEANDGGLVMLVRFVSGGLHPFIQVGYGAEFGSDIMIATGLAQTAVHHALPPSIFNLDCTADEVSDGISFLEVLRCVYDSEVLQPPMPYDPNGSFKQRQEAIVDGVRDHEIHRICSLYKINASTNESLQRHVEEFIWTSTLLVFSTGVKEGKAPRIDFFLMHLLTSSLFLPSLFDIMVNPTHKCMLIRAYVSITIFYTLASGRPRINPGLLMSYSQYPRPPASFLHLPYDDPVQKSLRNREYNPWPKMLEAVVFHPDAHTTKVLRTLAFAAQHYGHTPPGHPIGCVGSHTANSEEKEIHLGSLIMDGTIFVRAAGVLMDYMGWVTYGQRARDDWDRTGLGWNAAWDDEN
ncbi:hypothetical protein BDQ12DRAFT_645990 [Crucibulum laeve]|uniref:Oxidoreductase AflY n=1 Tax=Crucibulum laeve TaxID=68775 RepID=A0A5C3MCE5_9AGAR|nr:hypothetical protein BDQ12DRAFT_645990 [Crucibulum laeve]